jgi:hypothetical protein
MPIPFTTMKNFTPINTLSYLIEVLAKLELISQKTDGNITFNDIAKMIDRRSRD